jgi:hypothetical protein
MDAGLTPHAMSPPDTALAVPVAVSLWYSTCAGKGISVATGAMKQHCVLSIGGGHCRCSACP